MESWMSTFTTITSQAIYNHIYQMTIRADTAQLFGQAYESAYEELGRPAHQDFVQIITKQTSDWYIKRMQSEHLSVKHLEEKTFKRFNEYELQLATVKEGQAKTLELVKNDLHLTRQLRLEVKDDFHELQKKYDLLQSRMDVLMKQRSQHSQKSEQSKIMVNLPGSIHSNASIDLRKSNMHMISEQNGSYNMEDERFNIQRPKRVSKPNQGQLSQEIRPIVQNQRSIDIMDPQFKLLSVSNKGYLINQRSIQQKEKGEHIDQVNQIIWSQECYQCNPIYIFCTTSGLVRQSCMKVDQKTSKNQVLWEIWLSDSVLCVDFSEKKQFFYVGLSSGEILAIQKQSKMKIKFEGNHNAPICGLYWMENRNTLMTLGLDNRIKFWSEQALILELNLPFKTATCAFSDPWLLIGSCQETIAIINIKLFPNLHDLTANIYQKINANLIGKFLSSNIHGQSQTAVISNINGYVLTFTFSEELKESNYKIVKYCVLERQTIEDKKLHQLKGKPTDIGCIDSKIIIAIGKSHYLLMCDPDHKTNHQVITSPSRRLGPSSVIKFSPDCKLIGVGEISRCRKKSSRPMPLEPSKAIIVDLETMQL